MASLIKICGKLLFFLILAIFLLVVSLYYLNQEKYSGVIHHPHSHIGEISIYRDKFGIPHINASTYTDAIYGLGFVHSQDRLWSIHIKRRIQQGRLSEFAGRDTLQVDILMRQTEFYEQADKNYKNLTPFEKTILDNYCLGFNDALAQRKVLPIEFLLTGQTFEPWQPQDTFALAQLMNFFMTLDFMFEPFKNMVREKYGQDIAEEVFAAKAKYLFDNVTILNDDDLKQSNIFKEFLGDDDIRNSKSKETSEKPHIPKELKSGYFELFNVDFFNRMLQTSGKGSNNWAVTGNLSFTGLPLIANDPHLENTMPSAWYLNELLFTHNNRSRFACGATIPGLPLMMLGRTNYLAWTITNNMADTSDTYLETVNNTDNTYLFDGKWVKMQVKDTFITVKGEEDRPIKVTQRRTHHGPTLDILCDLANIKNPIRLNYTFSLAWHGHIERASQYLAGFHMVTADSPSQFENALWLFENPVLNIVYATVDNHIGYCNIGRLPVRSNPEDIFVKDGSDSNNDWLRFYNKSEQPRVVDPRKGFIVTANNKVAGDNLLHRVSSTQLTIARSYRATQLLEQQIAQKKLFTLQDFMKFQLDVVDAYCVRAKPHMVSLFRKFGRSVIQNRESYDRIKQAFDILEEWNCSMDSKGKMAVGAAIYGVWEQKFVIHFFNDMQKDQYLNNRATMNLIFDQFLFRNILRWDDDNLPEEQRKLNADYCQSDETRRAKTDKACIHNFFLSINNTINLIEEKCGKNRENWQWGKVNLLVYKHSIFTDTPLKFIFDRSRQGYGNRRTINVGGINLIRDEWKSIYSANLRTVISLDNNTKSYYVTDTGQSENIFSTHYDDQMRLFEKGEYIEMIYGQNRLLENNQDILHISYKDPYNTATLNYNDKKEQNFEL